MKSLYSRTVRHTRRPNENGVSPYPPLDRVFRVSGISPVRAENTVNRYSILFGWKTDGSHELLARQASAFRTYHDDRSLAISFGSLLGNTLIVRHDTADQFLSATRDAGYDYIIPGSPEFMFGAETAIRFSENERYPRFISANLVDKTTRKTVFEPYATWYVSGLRICIIAFSDTSIAKQTRSGAIKGIDVMSYDETLTALSVPVAREHADIVIAAGRIDRAAVLDIARKHPYVDMFLTNSQSGGFFDAKGATTNALVSGKSLFVGPEEGTKLGMLSLHDTGGVETREFSTITLGDAFPPDKDLLASLNRTLDEFKRRDTEETAVLKTGTAVTAALKDIFGVSAVFLHRQSLFYYPLKDSLTMFNVRNIVRPYEKLTRFEVKGSVLTSVLTDMKSRKDPDDRLIFAGLGADGKIDSLRWSRTAPMSFSQPRTSVRAEKGTCNFRVERTKPSPTSTCSRRSRITSWPRTSASGSSREKRRGRLSQI